MSCQQVPGVTYVPLVGKVTVAMLERNLMRLYEQYHARDAVGKDFRCESITSPPLPSMPPA